MKRSVSLLAVLTGVLMALWAPQAALAADPTMDVTAFCVDDEGQFVWTVDVNVNGSITVTQGDDGQSITQDVRAGDENMTVVGLAGEGDVTFTLDGTDVVVVIAGSDDPCWPAESGVAVLASKATICHVPKGNPDNAHTITIDRHALKAHLGDNAAGLHGGDYFGECKDDAPAPTDTPDQTDSPDSPVRPRATLPPTSTVSQTEVTGLVSSTFAVGMVIGALLVSFGVVYGVIRRR